jgi:hypothetical protein
LIWLNSKPHSFTCKGVCFATLSDAYLAKRQLYFLHQLHCDTCKSFILHIHSNHQIKVREEMTIYHSERGFESKSGAMYTLAQIQQLRDAGFIVEVIY